MFLKVKESAVKIAVQWSVEKSMKFFHSKSQGLFISKYSGTSLKGHLKYGHLSDQDSF